MGLAIAAALPHLGALSALVSSYTQEPSGWYALSTVSYMARAGIAVVLLTPITVLMGGTLTLLIRHLVRSDLGLGGWRIAQLYGINTAGAALGCVLTDFTLVPASGLWGAQMVAVFFNVVAGAGALLLSTRPAGRRAVSSVRLVERHAPPGSGPPHRPVRRGLSPRCRPLMACRDERSCSRAWRSR